MSPDQFGAGVAGSAPGPVYCPDSLPPRRLPLSRRTEKISQAIRQVVSTAILFELRDPRVKHVTVLRAEVAGDLRSAKVYISVLGEDKQARLTLQGLDASRGWIQSRIADELDLRWTPVLTFVLDDAVKKSIEVSRLLRESLPATDEAPEPEQPLDDESASGDVESEVADDEFATDPLDETSSVDDDCDDTLPDDPLPGDAVVGSDHEDASGAL